MDGCPIEPSKSSSSWMMSALTCSRRNCFTRNIPSPMTMAEVSSGLGHLAESKHQPLLSQHNNLQPSKTNLPKPNHPLFFAFLAQKDDRSPFPTGRSLDQQRCPRS